MNTTHIHTCSYHCIRPACVLEQRDELRERCETLAKELGRVIAENLDLTQKLDTMNRDRGYNPHA